MIDDILGLAATGVYTTTFFFGMLVRLPSRALLKASSVYIADAWKDHDLSLIKSIYAKSSLTQFIIGILILIGIWGNIENVFNILPPEFEAGRYVILFVGVAFLFDMIAGSSGAILATSIHYKKQTLFKVIMIVVLIITNLIFIPLWGITGAAVATALSKFIHHLIKFIFLYYKYGMQPYNIGYIYVLVIAIAAYGAGYMVPELPNYILDLVLRSAIMLAIFASAVLVFRISGDVNDMAKSLFDRFFRRNRSK